MSKNFCQESKLKILNKGGILKTQILSKTQESRQSEATNGRTHLVRAPTCPATAQFANLSKLAL